MKMIYIATSTLICGLFLYANVIGWDVTSSLMSGRFSPHGQSGHSFYHK